LQPLERVGGGGGTLLALERPSPLQSVREEGGGSIVPAMEELDGAMESRMFARRAWNSTCGGEGGREGGWRWGGHLADEALVPQLLELPQRHGWIHLR
jgi:hypothetical protein